jgi:hypothetical protein
MEVIGILLMKGMKSVRLLLGLVLVDQIPQVMSKM